MERVTTLNSTFLIFASVLVLVSPVVTQENQVTANSELTKARESVRSTQQRYESLKKLEASGSVSQREMRVANFYRRTAILDLSVLLDPSQRNRIQQIRAKLVYQFRLEEYQSIDELYKKGAASKHDYDRASAALEVARTNLKAAQSESETKRHVHAIKAARTKLELAKKELAIAQKLFQSGSLSQTTYKRAQSNYRISQSEYEEVRQGLGASANQVKQSPSSKN